MKKNKNVMTTTLLAICLLFFVFPVVYMVVVSFENTRDLFSSNPLVFQPILTGYYSLLTIWDIPKYAFNSLAASAGATGLIIVIASLAAYSFGRFRFRWMKLLLFLTLFCRMLPPIAMIVPLFLTMAFWGIIDTIPALILLYTAFELPFAVWMLRAFLMGIPEDIEEMATIDGCTRLGAFFRVTLPLLAPGLSATAIYIFSTCWNDFLIALTFTSTRATTLPLLSAALHESYGTYWTTVGSLGTIAVLPVIAFMIIFQRYIVKGLAFGAVKR